MNKGIAKLEYMLLTRLYCVQPLSKLPRPTLAMVVLGYSSMPDSMLTIPYEEDSETGMGQMVGELGLESRLRATFR